MPHSTHSHESADVVIIGGGVFGNSVAYHYCAANPGKKVILLERLTLCNAASSRAAAMITKVRAKREFIPLAQRTYKAIEEMEELLNESLGIRTVGILHAAASEKKVRELDELVQIAEEVQEEAEYISGEEAEKMAPWLDTSSIFKMAFMPNEAFCDPYLLGTFYARSAKQLGADIRSGVAVEEIILRENVVTGVRTSNGTIEAGVTVLASGAWAPVLAKKLGVELPLAPVRSQYWITKESPLFPETTPMVVLPDVSAYFRPESGGLLFGIREQKSWALAPQLIPDDIRQVPFSEDRGMADLTEALDGLGAFFPAVYDIGIKHYIAGFSAYTPDNYLSMGPFDGLKNVLFATGCVGAGIAVCGGVGHAIAELAAGRRNPYDFSAFRLDRFGPIDSFSQEWVQRCADARARKTSG